MLVPKILTYLITSNGQWFLWNRKIPILLYCYSEKVSQSNPLRKHTLHLDRLTSHGKSEFPSIQLKISKNAVEFFSWLTQWTNYCPTLNGTIFVLLQILQKTLYFYMNMFNTSTILHFLLFTLGNLPCPQYTLPVSKEFIFFRFFFQPPILEGWTLGHATKHVLCDKLLQAVIFFVAPL